MFGFDSEKPVYPQDMAGVAIAITLSYFSYSIYKGLTFKESLETIGIKVPPGIPDSWNLINLSDMCEIIVEANGIKVKSNETLQAYFVSIADDLDD